MITDKDFKELEKMAKLKFAEEGGKEIMIELNKIIDKLKILSREK
jgi:Asp-tRNA(Asn)/Glu-tRNA(Gln) amidotransferase C subunit